MDDLERIRNAITTEEKFLPEIHVLMDERLLELGLSDDKMDEARQLLKILLRDSTNHYNLLKAAYIERGGSEDD